MCDVVELQLLFGLWSCTMALIKQAVCSLMRSPPQSPSSLQTRLSLLTQPPNAPPSLPCLSPDLSPNLPTLPLLSPPHLLTSPIDQSNSNHYFCGRRFLSSGTFFYPQTLFVMERRVRNTLH